MRWTKLGRIFEPGGQAPWIVTHSALPIVDPIDHGYRVYFCSRDQNGRSQIGYGHLTLDDRPGQLDGISSEPVLRPGSLGAFDDAAARNGLLRACEERGIPVYAYATFGGPKRAARLLRDRVLVDLARERGTTPARLFLAYLRALSPVIVPIVGATRVESVTDCAEHLQVSNSPMTVAVESSRVMLPSLCAISPGKWPQFT